MIGKIIKQLRKDKNITQADLAKAVGVTTSSIGMYETEVRNPSYEVIVKLANYFDVTTDYLLNNSKKEDLMNNSNKQSKKIDTIAAHLEGKNITPQKMKLLEKYINALFEEDD